MGQLYNAGENIDACILAICIIKLGWCCDPPPPWGRGRQAGRGVYTFDLKSGQQTFVVCYIIERFSSLCLYHIYLVQVTYNQVQKVNSLKLTSRFYEKIGRGGILKYQVKKCCFFSAFTA